MSIAPLMLASVSTRVVSWKLAAEMKLSVESEALVMPSSSGRPIARTATFPDHALVLFAEAEAIDLLFEQEVRVAHFIDAHPAQHLADNHFDVLVRDGHALQTVDFLDFVDQVSLQFLFAQHGKNVVRVQGTVHQRVAGTKAFAFLHVDVDTARYRVFLLVAIVSRDVDLALTLGNFAEADHTVDLADDGRFARLAGFEQFDHARQTAGDVLGTRRLLWNLGEHIAGTHLIAVLDHEVSTARQQVTLVRLGVLDEECRLALLIGSVGNHPAREAGDFVDFLVEGDAFLQILELYRAADFREDGVGVRDPTLPATGRA